MIRSISLLTLLFVFVSALPSSAQHSNGHDSADERSHSVPSFVSPSQHSMWMRNVGGGWHLMGMGQVFPHMNVGAPFAEDSPLTRTDFYATQPSLMANLESPGQRLTLRTTFSFEGLAIGNGETTFGGWGEGFIDSRHPHTLLHEAVLSLNFWDAGPGQLSIFAGKGFVPFGTDDPMGRPVQKFPTNHHLSQILERFLVGAAYITDNGWNLEASMFGGNEPEGPYDLSNVTPWGNSWAARIGRRFGGGPGTLSTWETTASYAQVRETHGHDGHTDLTELYNAAARYAGDNGLYGLISGSVSAPEEGDGYFSILGEGLWAQGPHQPYVRLEYATRPEYDRDGEPGTNQFFRYDHGEGAIGATRWLVSSIGYGYTLTDLPLLLRPYAEVQHHAVSEERGSIDPTDLFGTSNFWNISFGVRIFLGGDQMRMGTYGILDSMTLGHRQQNNNHALEGGNMHDQHE